jgi:hypothetical protein
MSSRAIYSSENKTWVRNTGLMPKSLRFYSNIPPYFKPIAFGLIPYPINPYSERYCIYLLELLFNSSTNQHIAFCQSLTVSCMLV